MWRIKDFTFLRVSKSDKCFLVDESRRVFIVRTRRLLHRTGVHEVFGVHRPIVTLLIPKSEVGRLGRVALLRVSVFPLKSKLGNFKRVSVGRVISPLVLRVFFVQLLLFISHFLINLMVLVRGNKIRLVFAKTEIDFVLSFLMACCLCQGHFPSWLEARVSRIRPLIHTVSRGRLFLPLQFYICLSSPCFCILLVLQVVFVGILGVPLHLSAAAC